MAKSFEDMSLAEMQEIVDKKRKAEIGNVNKKRAILYVMEECTELVRKNIATALNVQKIRGMGKAGEIVKDQVDLTDVASKLLLYIEKSILRDVKFPEEE